MLIAEELFLLLTRDDGKRESGSSYAAYGFAAANIIDLVLRERVTLSEDKDPRVSVVDPSPTDHPALDDALARLREKDGKKISSLIVDGKVAAEKQIVASLKRAGVVSVEEARMLGIVPEKRPVADPTPERHIRERLRVALQGAEVTPKEATLLAILQGLDVAPKILAEEAGGMGKKELKQRIEVVSQNLTTGEAVSAAVARAVAAMNAAMVAAVIVPAVTASS